MNAVARIEKALGGAMLCAGSPGAPPKLIAAMSHAVFPPGARVRPRLCLAVASACGDADPPLADAAGAALELLHCASLIHDDLPCFDDADIRRGKASVYRAFGEPLAVLAGDALIVLAFQTIARAPSPCERMAPALIAVADAVGAPNGIAAGQAWECEPLVDLSVYQRQKTGSLFSAAAAAGAIAGGGDPVEWRPLGDTIGDAYQAADDIRDAVATVEEMGKPNGRDSVLGRPSVVSELGLAEAVRHLEGLVARALSLIPACRGEEALRSLIMLEAERLRPKRLAQAAA